MCTRAHREGGGWVLQGAKAVVQRGQAANLRLVSARIVGNDFDQNGISLFLLPSHAWGLRWQAYPKIDGGRAAELALEEVKLPGTAAVAWPGNSLCSTMPSGGC